MTKNQNAIKAPYTANELYKLAETEANKHKIPEIYREDAIAEFVAAGFEAIERSKETIRGYQFTRGRGAMLDFMKKELRHSQITPECCLDDASRVSLDMPVPGSDGEYTTLAETIIDCKAVIPGENCKNLEKKSDVRNALAQLPPNESEAAQRVWMNGESQKEAAKAMGIGRGKIQYLLNNAMEKLQILLAKYEPEYRS